MSSSQTMKMKEFCHHFANV